MNSFSKIISGTMTWGQWGSKFTTNEMQYLIDQIVDLGINTFDHADIYGGYTTEATFGTAFNNSAVNRESVYFISKCSIQMPCDARSLPVKYYDYSAKHIRMSVENSLRQLKTDYLDLLLFHRPSPLMNAETIAKVIQELKSEGKINQLGVSNFTPSQMQLLQQEIDLKWNQLECSLTQEKSLFDGTLDYMKINNIGVMAWSPLGSFFKEKGVKNERVLKCMASLCEKYNCTEGQLLLAWLLYHPSKIHPVVGTTSAKRLALSMAALDVKLEITDWFLLLEASMGEPLP
tara:strand:+ start:319 stop:1185 length:867 start_codon:yes stop_codon:yes gene_type:complete